MTNSQDYILHDVIRIEQEARRLRAEFIARTLRSAWNRLAGRVPTGGMTARG